MPKRKFTPKKGQIDFTDARYAPVINTVVTKGGKVLLVQRSKNLNFYPGYWNGISGFLDDRQSIEQKVRGELREELGIKAGDIAGIRRGNMIVQEAPDYNKTWLVMPILATVDTDKFKLDWEAKTAKWFTPNQARKLKLLPGFDAVLAQFFR